MGGLLHLVQRGGAWAAAAPPSPLLAAHPSTTSVLTLYYSMPHYNYLCTVKGQPFIDEPVEIHGTNDQLMTDSADATDQLL